MNISKIDKSWLIILVLFVSIFAYQRYNEYNFAQKDFFSEVRSKHISCHSETKTRNNKCDFSAKVRYDNEDFVIYLTYKDFENTGVFDKINVTPKFSILTGLSDNSPVEYDSVLNWLLSPIAFIVGFIILLVNVLILTAIIIFFLLWFFIRDKEKEPS
jgi:hypothetical protein